MAERQADDTPEGRCRALTPRQKDCLRLVLSLDGSKEIGLSLGISPNVVDKHIKAAMRMLGVSRRRGAARLLADFEGRPGDQRLVPPSQVLPAASFEAAVTPIQHEGLQPGGVEAGAFREEQAAFFAPPRVLSASRPALLPLRYGEYRNDLTAIQRLGWVLAIIVGTALTFGVLAIGVEGLGKVGLSLAHH